MKGQIMKHVRCLIAALMLTLPAAMPAGTTDQYHRHTPRTETDTDAADSQPKAAGTATAAQTGQKTGSATAATPQQSSGKTVKSKQKSGRKAATAKKDSTKKAGSDATEEITAYSDTTSQDDYDDWAEDSMTYSGFSYTADEAFGNAIDDLLSMGGTMLGTLLILLILFVFSPLAILGLILYFVYKNRKQKYRLAEMAIKAGQPIPENMRIKTGTGSEDTMSKGVKNIFLGAGLMAFFWVLDISVGIGIGLLVMFNGAGQAVIAYTAERRRRRDGLNDGPDGSDNGTEDYR